jgi:hypothetical protein
VNERSVGGAGEETAEDSAVESISEPERIETELSEEQLKELFKLGQISVSKKMNIYFQVL